MLLIIAYIIILILSCNKEVNTKMKDIISIEFPLRGTWISPNTPGKKIPSHGIDKYGETYAYDFVGVDENSGINKFYKVPFLTYVFSGVKLEDCYGWGSGIFAPCDGEIVKVEDGIKERNPVILKNDMKYIREITRRFENGDADYREVAGNYIILKCSEKVYALFAHIMEKSITIKMGEKVKRGQLLARVGHSGNSTAPHLHYQLMDNIDPKKSKGIPCSFTDYEELRNKKWENVKNGIPSVYRIRK